MLFWIKLEDMRALYIWVDSSMAERQVVALLIVVRFPVIPPEVIGIGYEVKLPLADATKEDRRPICGLWLMTCRNK